MYLHLMRDDKFIDEFIELVKKYFDTSDHLFLAVSGRKPIYVGHDIPWAPYPSAKFDKIVGDVKRFSKVFVHFLDYKKSKFLVDNVFNAKIYWMLWGADYFEREPFKLYDSKTLAFCKRNGFFPKRETPVENYRFRIDKFYRKRTGKTLDFLIEEDEAKRIRQIQKKQSILREARSKIDFICHYNPEDYKLIRKSWKMSAEHLPFFYANRISFKTLDSVKESNKIEIPFESEDYPTILLGNSGNPSNNHIEIIDALAKVKTDFQAVCPLSYGDERYIKSFVPYARNKLGDRFIALTEFMSRDKFAGIINSVDLICMNHNRPQGMGNIIAALYYGKKTLIKNGNSTKKFLQSLGVLVYDIKKLTRILKNEDAALSNEIKESTAQIIFDFFSEKSASRNLKRIFES